jgi:hypothetical protein
MSMIPPIREKLNLGTTSPFLMLHGRDRYWHPVRWIEVLIPAPQIERSVFVLTVRKFPFALCALADYKRQLLTGPAA